MKAISRLGLPRSYNQKPRAPLHLRRQVLIGLSIMASTTRAFSEHPSQRTPYHPPAWAEQVLTNVPPNGRLHIANLPTPVYKLSPTNATPNSILQKLADLDISLWIKRDDMSGGVETGGNKIRKLEFLLADALANNYKSVVTIGGEQSNHCRATAAAARMVGLEPHLILRTARADQIQTGVDDVGYTGNILFDRMVGSTIYTCTTGEYGRVGSVQLVQRVCKHLENTQQKGAPYPIPVGGSNALGTWGYINAVDELLTQWKSLESQPSLDHVVFASGSGGTAAGIATGLALAHGAALDEPSPPGPTVHAVGVCDTPDYFYDYCAGIVDGMGATLPSAMSTESFLRQHMTVHQGKGLGYAASTSAELDFVTDFALETGIVLDPVYSGKGLYHFMTHVLEQDPEKYRGTNILFWHTGGAVGLFDKGSDLLSTLSKVAPAKRLDVYGKGNNGIDISQPIAE